MGSSGVGVGGGGRVVGRGRGIGDSKRIVWEERPRRKDKGEERKKTKKKKDAPIASVAFP